MSLARPRVPAGLRSGQALGKATSDPTPVFGLTVPALGDVYCYCGVRDACLSNTCMVSRLLSSYVIVTIRSAMNSRLNPLQLEVLQAANCMSNMKGGISLG